MKIKYNIIEKSQVANCKESYTLGQALDVLEESGYRCIPVLDESEKMFVGNIYVQQVYEALAKHTLSKEDTIASLIQDKDVFMQEDASFFRIFSLIKRYPYLAILNEREEFAGILTHANVMAILEDSWGIQSGNYTLTVSTQEYQGALSLLVESIREYTSLHSLMTLDNESTFFRRIIVTLPSDVTEDTLERLINHLEDRGFRVFDVEKI
ncbi:CBS domain-containing protein [Paenalkalicoccus suaedae]|uniref:CBS domain-containing protein n=1 Tax=Paenalkalicoccus suaedae TaxID=2592382 RepID=A0A859FE55_9BACI|nr:cyclic di-AMP binding protein CbpA [Paenalkalicoccus suaedae]QKS71138.1 CBS domain-containing protein [Paenalkalicoccus suaedae]